MPICTAKTGETLKKTLMSFWYFLIAYHCLLSIVVWTGKNITKNNNVHGELPGSSFGEKASAKSLQLVAGTSHIV